jgi:hypothetical protein
MSRRLPFNGGLIDPLALRLLPGAAAGRTHLDCAMFRGGWIGERPIRLSTRVLRSNAAPGRANGAAGSAGRTRDANCLSGARLTSMQLWRLMAAAGRRWISV